MNEESLFHEALAQSTPQARQRFLEAACAGQPELRAAIESLLSAHATSGNFMCRPVVVAAEPNSAEGASMNLETVNQDGTTDPEKLAPLEAPRVPERIGRYEVRQLLGRGGMGAVYLAHDPELHRLVALKIPRLVGPGAEERFLREARATAAVSHPNLCPVYDAGRADGVLYLAMAYVPGSTLADRLRKEGSLPAARAVETATCIAKAMAEAHRHGIVHRDLKPGNVLLDRHGEPVVTDFGLALRGPISSAENPQQTAEFQPRLTQAGILIGTPTYMPPEQACGDLDKLGPASDVYALGAILFELLTGRPPFRADTIAQLVRKIVAEPADPPSRLRPGIPASLDAICSKALAKEPADRFASMEEFASALAAALARPKRRTKTGIAAAAFFLLVIAAVVLYVKTDCGTIEVRVNDPSANVHVSVDGSEVAITEHGRITKLRAGPHGLVVEGPDFETETKLFKVKRGETTIVEVTLKPRSFASTGPVKIEPALTDSNQKRLAGLLASGRQLISKDQFDELGPVVDDALKIEAQSPGALALRATFRASRNDLINARADADAALKLNPENYRALYVRAYLNFVNEKNNESVADATAAIRLEPTDPSVWANRASSYLRLGEFKQAILDANQAIELGARREHVYINRGAAYACLGDYARALADFDTAAQIAESNPTVFIHRSAVHLKVGNTEQAAADWAAARKLDPTLTARPVIPDPPKPPKRNELSPEETDKLSDALAAIEQALSRDGTAAALKFADEALKIDPTSAAAWVSRCRALTELGRHREALEETAKAFPFAPDNTHLYLSRGVARGATTTPVAAIPDLTIALTLAPDNAYAWGNRGYAYAQTGQYHQAIADLTRSIELKSTPVFLSNRGSCYVYLGQYENALADYELVAQLQPSSPQWPLICSAIRARLGDFDGARAYRERAINIDPRVKDAPENALPVPLPPAKKDPELPH